MLLDEIIEILADENGSLNNALLKTKVLLHTIGKKDLVPWVEKEQKGYSNDEDVPDYRNVGAYVYGLAQAGLQVHKHFLVPIMHLDEETQRALTQFKLRMPIDQIQSSVEQYKQGSSKKVLGQPIPPEICMALSAGLESGHVITASSELNMAHVEKILIEVRSRLLDFMLELRDAVGIDVPNKELAEKSAKFDTRAAFTKTILEGANISNSTFVIGDNNSLVVTNTKNDIDSLLREVKKIGLPQKSVDELRDAIKEDERAGKEVEVTDGKTGKWFTKTLKEAGKGIVKVGVDVLSTTVVKAIQSYTGTGTP